ncbi:MAG: EamA family transporter, partial [Aldersonia sp.]|nr:EamA family transporter [Aldersonia sp.]
MTARDRSLALLVVLLWGLNFIAIHASLEVLPPFFLAALRFLVMAVPVVLFVPRPEVPLRWLLLYSLGFGVVQFAFLFTAMNVGMATGLASLVLQSSAPFTVVLGVLLLRERIDAKQVAGLVVAVAGMVLIGWDRAAHATLVPVILTLLGGLGWALGNLGARLAKPPQPLHLTLWMSVVPPLPMLALSAAAEGPTTGWRAMFDAIGAQDWSPFAGLAYTVVLGTIVGSGIWTALLGRYPAGMVAPFSLLVPVVGVAASWLLLDEKPT